MNKINFIEGKKELLPEVIHLREKLLIHHKNLGHKFKEEFINKLKNNNIENILAGKNYKDIKIIITTCNNKNIGFCLGLITEENIGEINTLYVDTEYQKTGIGAELMEKIIKWMDENKVSSKELSVCSGNENVFKFYEKFNFYPRKTLLKQIK